MNTVYIVDDNLLDRVMLEGTLQKMGFEVLAFQNGTEIYEAIQKADKPVIALLDWLMPDMSGIDICNNLTKNPPPKPVFKIIVTSRTHKSDIAYALDNGADDFVAKPFDVSELRARINVGLRLISSWQQLLDSHEKLLEHTKNVENLAKARAEQLVHADRLSTIGILSAGMAHEINNPTSFVSVNIQTLEENLPCLKDAFLDQSSEEKLQKAQFFLATIPEIIDEMKNGVARIRNIVDGLKTYTHLTHDHNEDFNIDECIESALHLCVNKLKYHMTVEKELVKTPSIRGDRLKLEQVFINLITNATDAIEETHKEGVLHISTKYINGNVVAIVWDNGPGIPKETLGKIFMPFFTTKPVGKGTGIGLSISSNIVKDHGGELTVENHPSGGAQFIISLPSSYKGQL